MVPKEAIISKNYVIFLLCFISLGICGYLGNSRSPIKKTGPT